VIGALSLAIYIIGFSLAYATLDAGLGALILFGVVQVSIFAYSAVLGHRPSARQCVGAGIAFIGLLIALWPKDTGGDVTGAALMVFAGLGWAAYTLVGKGAQDPLAATTVNFVLATPVLLGLLAFYPLAANLTGICFAVICGGLTSGLGYALWYTVLPKMTATTASVVQLSVPIIAIFAGAVLLGETVSFAIILASFLVVGGIALALTSKARITRPN